MYVERGTKGLHTDEEDANHEIEVKTDLPCVVVQTQQRI
jgi:hypothetical protein